MTSDIITTDLEKQSLEAHVDLCSMRYKQLETRLSVLEVKVDSISKALSDANNGLKAVIISSTGTIVAGILGLIVTIIMKF